MIYTSPSNDRHPVTNTFTPLHFYVIVRHSNSLRPYSVKMAPCCYLAAVWAYQPVPR